MRIELLGRFTQAASPRERTVNGGCDAPQATLADADSADGSRSARKGWFKQLDDHCSTTAQRLVAKLAGHE
jgi:hypothetical protein